MLTPEVQNGAHVSEELLEWYRCNPANLFHN